MLPRAVLATRLTFQAARVRRRGGLDWTGLQAQHLEALGAGGAGAFDGFATTAAAKGYLVELSQCVAGPQQHQRTDLPCSPRCLLFGVCLQRGVPPSSQRGVPHSSIAYLIPAWRASIQRTTPAWRAHLYHADTLAPASTCKGLCAHRKRRITAPFSHYLLNRQHPGTIGE
jgi:hypothetical protein